MVGWLSHLGIRFTSYQLLTQPSSIYHCLQSVTMLILCHTYSDDWTGRVVESYLRQKLLTCVMLSSTLLFLMDWPGSHRQFLWYSKYHPTGNHVLLAENYGLFVFFHQHITVIKLSAFVVDDLLVSLCWTRSWVIFGDCYVDLHHVPILWLYKAESFWSLDSISVSVMT